MIGSCVICGNGYKYKPSRPYKCCSRQCGAIIRTGRTMPHKGKPWSEERRGAQPPKKPVMISGKEYDANWHEIRKEIYRRDNWHCQECGVKTSIKQDKTKIACHHIDYNITNNVPENLITLCVSCHMKTNFRRSDWEKYYQNKLNGLLV